MGMMVVVVVVVGLKSFLAIITYHNIHNNIIFMHFSHIPSSRYHIAAIHIQSELLQIYSNTYNKNDVTVYFIGDQNDSSWRSSLNSSVLLWLDGKNATIHSPSFLTLITNTHIISHHLRLRH